MIDRTVRACTRARGDERLSGRQQGESGRGRHGGTPRKKAGKKTGKHRASDIGRALRSVYDDTLRESVPSDFNDLLGKLS